MGRRRSEGLLTAEELEAMWRPRPDFIGPVAPPMWLWLHAREIDRYRLIERNRELAKDLKAYFSEL